MTKSLSPKWPTPPPPPTMSPHDISQIDDLYTALARYETAKGGVTRYIEQLLIADTCWPGAHVLEIGCGNGLLLPMLYRYAPFISSYTGIAVIPTDLSAAKEHLAMLDAQYSPRPFPVELLDWNIGGPWPDDTTYDIAVCTPAIESLTPTHAIESLNQTAKHLSSGGTLYLTTTNPHTTAAVTPSRAKHTHTWHADEIVTVLTAAGITVRQRIGLRVVERQPTEKLTEIYGPEAVWWHATLATIIPCPFGDIIEAAALQETASEILHICN